MDYYGEHRPETVQNPNTTAAETTSLDNRAGVSRGTSASDSRRTTGKTRLSPFKKARALVFAFVVCLVAVGLAFRTGTGTPSSFGLDTVAAICPLGALETMLSAHEIMLRPLVLLAIMVVVIVLLGKAFCAWMCPAPWLQRIFKPSKHKPAGETTCTNSSTAHFCSCTDDQHCSTCALDPIGGTRDGIHLDTRHATLLGVLGATAIFGFPVFCLVCPIGLTFATFIGLWHLFQFNETSWGLFIFPAILALEVVFLRKWCTNICPVSALLSLISNANRTLRPRVHHQVCLRTSGIDCHACIEACPEHVDPHSRHIPECSKCGACVEACPAKAINIKLLPRT